MSPLIRIGPAAFSSYHVFNTAAALVVLLLLLTWWRRQGLAFPEILLGWAIGIFLTIVGAAALNRLLNAIFGTGLSFRSPSCGGLGFYSEGSTILGGITGLLLGVGGLLIPVYRKKALALADSAFLAMTLGQAVGRIGCFLAGCCYGKPTGLPWGVVFPDGVRVEYSLADVPLHPVQIYESILNGASFLILWTIFRRKHYDGQVFSLSLINYGFIRFFLEYLRGDTRDLVRGPSAALSLSVSQILALGFVVTGLLIMAAAGRSRRGGPREAHTP